MKKIINANEAEYLKKPTVNPEFILKIFDDNIRCSICKEVIDPMFEERIQVFMYHNKCRSNEERVKEIDQVMNGDQDGIK